MNDHSLPPDELASAFLDDELSAAEAEAARQDPELAARADALRQATEAVGETVTPPPGAADAAVEAALADFDARRSSAAELAQRRPRGLTVIAGVAAAVAIGFIVAAAVGLFAEWGTDQDQDTAAAPAPAPAAQAAAAPPPEPAPEPPPPADEALAAPAPAEEPAADTEADTEAMEAIQAAEAMAQEALEIAEDAQAAAALAQATAEGNQAAVAAAEADLAEAQAAAEAAQAEAAAAQAEASEARAAAAEAEPAAAAAAQADAPAPEPPPPPAADDMAADLPLEACAAAIGDGTVELRITVDDTPLLVVRTAQEEPAVLVAATCDEVPPG